MAAKCCECGMTYEDCEADFANSFFPPPEDNMDCNSLPKAGNDGVCPAALPFPPAPPPSPPMPPGSPPPSPWYETVFGGGLWG